MIYDCFTFFNELDLLEIRLNVLNEVVDKFVLIEATKTHSNYDKPLYFKQNKERFKKFEHKIIHVVVDEYPEFETAWTNENHQRNRIAKSLKDCQDDDTIIISDLDEIPNPDKILEYKDTQGIKAFKQNFFYCYLNNLSNEYWIYSKMLSYKDFKNILDDYSEYSESLMEKINQGTTATKIRQYLGDKNIIIENGGWHFSYLADLEKISYKMKSFAHQKFNSKEYTDIENIERRIKEGKDLFNRKGYKFQKIKITEKDFPQYIVDNQEKFKKYILPGAKYTINEYIQIKGKKQQKKKLLSDFICNFLPLKSWKRIIKNKLEEK